MRSGEESRPLLCLPHHDVPKSKAGPWASASPSLTEEGDYLSYLVFMNLGDQDKVTLHLSCPVSARDFQLTHPAF